MIYKGPLVYLEDGERFYFVKYDLEDRAFSVYLYKTEDQYTYASNLSGLLYSKDCFTYRVMVIAKNKQKALSKGYALISKWIRGLSKVLREDFNDKKIIKTQD